MLGGGILIIIGVGAIYLLLVLAEQSLLCSHLCHEMTPFAESLQTSSHQRLGLTCLSCHSQDNFSSHLSFILTARRMAVSHFTESYLADEKGLHRQITDFEVAKFNFRNYHQAEYPALFAECKYCHPQRLPGTFFLCVSKESLELINTHCERCHNNIFQQEEIPFAEYPQRFPEIHSSHLEGKTLCTRCHARVVHNPAPNQSTPSMQRCFRCHNDQQAPRTDCQLCHLATKNIFAGREGKDVLTLPSLKLELDCLDCHNEEAGYRATAEDCLDCHTQEHAAKLKNIQEEFRDKKEEIKNIYQQVKGLIADIPNPEDFAWASTIFNQAEYNYHYACLDGSNGIHNQEFTFKLLDRALTDLMLLHEELSR